MPGVHDADAQLLTGNQYRGDVSTNQGEHVLDTMGTEHLCNALATVPRTHCVCLQEAGRKEQQKVVFVNLYTISVVSLIHLTLEQRKHWRGRLTGVMQWRPF